MKAHLIAGLVLAALCGSAAAGAETAPNAPSAMSGALPLVLELGDSQLDPEAVRQAIETELRQPVELANSRPEAPSLSVVVRSNHTVTVSYRTSTGETRTRSIFMPENGARGAEVIALLSGNLSRDEAAELLAELGPKGASSEAAPGTSSEAATAQANGSAEPGEPKAASAIAAPARPPPPPPQPPPSGPPPLLQTHPPAINLSLSAPKALYRDSERRIFVGELGLVYSHVGELHGLGLNLFVLRTERDLRGLGFATFYNYTGGMVRGITASAIVNRRQRLRGLEVSGVLNLGTADARGLSVAGVTNLSSGERFEGAQVAGLVNRANGFQGAQVAGLVNRSSQFQGLQTAGLANWADGSQGMQVAGIFNRARAVTGAQVAGVANVTDAVSGLQLGVVNVAQSVRGVQLGLVNVAKRVEGTSIGLVSVADNGRVQPVLWASSSLWLNIAAKFTVGPVYTQAGLSFGARDQTYAYELGLGLHFKIGPLFLEPGAHYSEMRSTRHPFDHELIEYGHYRLAVGVDLGTISPFAGAGVLQRFAHSVDAPASVPVTAEIFGGVAFF